MKETDWRAAGYNTVAGTGYGQVAEWIELGDGYEIVQAGTPPATDQEFLDMLDGWKKMPSHFFSPTRVWNETSVFRRRPVPAAAAAPAPEGLPSDSAPLTDENEGDRLMRFFFG